MQAETTFPSRLAVDSDLLALAERAFGRAAGADPIDGNAVRVLIDADENYEAWLAAIANAKKSVLFESYILADDNVGGEFAAALARKAKEGVRVFVVVDWLGSLGAGALWPKLRDAAVDLRIFNPVRFTSPLGWLSRDHRKTIAVDGEIGFVSGLCVSDKWVGDPERRLEPWRDTGVEIRGPAVAAVERAFAQVWQACGATPFPLDLLSPLAGVRRVGDTRVRVVAGVPNATGTFRLDLVIASIAHRSLWLTDAYFVGTAPYVQALAAAARDGVDVRLLVPGASDIPAISPISRAGYRPLLEAGVRVFEWGGTMLHAKTAVADGTWSRIGSTNLNLASWMQNYELDVAIEDAAIGQRMAEQYERDLARATEIVLTRRNRVRRAQDPTGPRVRRATSGSAGRAAAGALSVGSAIGAALTDRRVLAPAEAGLVARLAIAAIVLAFVAAMWPRLVAWPLAAVGIWLGLAWIVKAVELRREAKRHAEDPGAWDDDAPDRAEGLRGHPGTEGAPVAGSKAPAEAPSVRP
jgi:cardiolipin synthase